MEKRELTCIGCPLGCVITVSMNGNEVMAVEGNTCKKGGDYACKEMTSPARIVTTTVPVAGGVYATVPVKTKTDIPKDKIFDCIRALKAVTVLAPIHIGDVVLENVAGTGVDVAATGNVEKNGSAVVS